MQPERTWSRHLVYRSERLRTTWKFRVAILTAVVLGVWLTHGWWTAAVANSLVCTSDTARSDAILIENFDPEYLLFELAARLRRAGVAPRILVPVPADPE